MKSDRLVRRCSKWRCGFSSTGRTLRAASSADTAQLSYHRWSHKYQPRSVRPNQKLSKYIQRRLPPRRLTSTKKIRDSNQNFRINPDSDTHVCQIAAKMLWIHYHVGISHFVEYRENRPATLWETLINLLKSAILQWRESKKSHTESVSGSGSLSKFNVNQFFRS